MGAEDGYGGPGMDVNSFGCVWSARDGCKEPWMGIESFDGYKGHRMCRSGLGLV